jgi:tetratricopeptide (TPR) repeat protein
MRGHDFMIAISPMLRRFCCLAAGVALLPRLAVAATPPADGWQKLWSNHNPEARAAFRATLKQQPAQPDALRGMGLLCMQEDDDLGTLQAWRPLYRSAPAHWAATAYWPMFVDAAERTGRWSLLDGAAQDIMAAPRVAPNLRTSARRVLADAADRAGKQAEAEKRWAEIGYLRKWRVIGPFDNISRSGFEKAYPPERELDLAKSYPGRDNQALHWERLLLVSRNGYCAVSAALGDHTAGAYYAATAVLAAQDQSAFLRFDPEGASKVFVNGRLVFQDDILRQRQSFLADPFTAPTTLRKGWNTILIKLAADDGVEAGFTLRITDAAGAALPGAAVDPAHAVTPTAGPSSPPPTAPESATIATLRKLPRDPESAFLLARHLRLSQDRDAAIEVLKAALVLSPTAGWLHWELSGILSEDEQADEARAERELARKQNSRLIEAQVDALSDEEDSVAAPERIRRLKALLTINPSSTEVHQALAEAYNEADLNDEALKSSRMAIATSAGPAECSWLFSVYLILGRKAEAATTLASGLRVTPNSEELLDAQVHLFIQQGKSTAAAAGYQRLLQLNPAEPRYRLELAELYQSGKNLKLATQTLRLAREHRPQDAEICARLGDVVRQMGDTKQAIALYRVAVKLAPARVALREKLQVLSGERPVVDLVPPTPDPPILAKTPKAAEVPGASAIYLLDEAREVVYPDFATVLRAHQVIKVFDAAGVKEFQEYPIGGSSHLAAATVERARLLKADGKVQDLTDEAGPGGVTFPSLAPGDVIDVSYRVEDYPRGGLAGHFWTQWSFATPEGPIKLCRYVLITPPEMTFQLRTQGTVPEPVVKDVQGWRTREWRVTDAPQHKQEVLGAPYTDSLDRLDISTFSSWKEIVRWYQDLSQPRCVPDAVLRAKAEELTREAKSEEEKIRAIVAFVAREIQYQSTPFRMSAYVPTEGKQVVREHYGDCKDKAALLTALLGAVGIKSNMVLLCGRSQGIVPWLPSPRFTHAIARVQTSNGPLWVDATADQMEFGGFPGEDQQVPALVIDDATTDLVLTPALAAEKNWTTDSHSGTLAEDGTLKASLELKAGGDWGWMLRSVMRMVPEANREEALRGVVARLVENSRFDSGALDHLDDPDHPIEMRFKYQVERFSNTAGNFVLARLPWGMGQTSAAEALLAGSAHTQELEVSGLRGHRISTVDLELPSGYVPQDLQPEVKGETPWGSYRFTYRLEGRVLHSHADVKFTAFRVRAQDLPRYVEFFKVVEQETKKQIVFKKS